MPWLPLDNFRSPAALARFALTTVLGLLLDLWTKWYAFHKLCISVWPNEQGHWRAVSRMYEAIPGVLQFEVTVNQGAVFGRLQGQWWLFIVISIAAIFFLTYLFAVSKQQRLYQFILGLLLAGVLGNMYDRIVYGYVRDMIHALPGWPNPLRFLYDAPEIFPWIFNVADSLLCVGVVMLAAYSLLQRPKSQEGSDRNVKVQS
jgi:signal peptidase II